MFNPELASMPIALIVFEKLIHGKSTPLASATFLYATLLIYVGADLFTVSKILGHSSIRVTQIYAKVMDESKRKAVNLIPI